MIARLAAALLLAVASVVLLGSAPAHACRCVVGDVARQVERADAVFVGSFARSDRTVADGRIVFDLAVDEVYHGQVAPHLTVRAPYASATCGLGGIPAGEPVVWFVRNASDGVPGSDLCSGTTPLTPTLARQLERAAGPASAPESGSPPPDAVGTDRGEGAASDTGPPGEDSGGAAGDDVTWWAWGAIGLTLVAGAAAAAGVWRTRRP